MQVVSSKRSGFVPYEAVRGDTWTKTSLFQIGGEDESFVGADLIMQIRNKAGVLIKELTIGDGISVEGGYVTYTLSDEFTATMKLGTYLYDVEKKLLGTTATIQHGTFNLLTDRSHE